MGSWDGTNPVLASRKPKTNAVGEETQGLRQSSKAKIKGRCLRFKVIAFY
ncbi:hypothetical protein FORC17_2076 [Vibrio vulnificus]|nr:hypothetical protein FORC17_2076 [Vibrio vulnificus]